MVIKPKLVFTPSQKNEKETNVIKLVIIWNVKWCDKCHFDNKHRYYWLLCKVPDILDNIPDKCSYYIQFSSTAHHWLPFTLQIYVTDQACYKVVELV